MKELTERLLNSARTFGWWAMATKGSAYGLMICFSRLADLLGALAVPSDRFDQRYGVSTHDPVELKDADVPDSAATMGKGYYPTYERVLKLILRDVTADIELQTFTFIDLGCGKGRALMMASHLPFQHVIGVDFSPQLVQDAKRNVEIFERITGSSVRSSVSVVCANALDFQPPDSDLVIYMYRPFIGHVMEGVLDRLASFRDQTGRRILIAYSCPVDEHLLIANGRFRKLRETRQLALEFSHSIWECTQAQTE